MIIEFWGSSHCNNQQAQFIGQTVIYSHVNVMFKHFLYNYHIMCRENLYNYFYIYAHDETLLAYIHYLVHMQYVFKGRNNRH